MEAALAAGFSALPWGKADRSFEDALNVFMKRLWPSVSEAVQAMVMETVPPAIRDALPHMINGMVTFDKFDLGEVAPTITDICVEEIENGLRVRLHVEAENAADAKVSVAGVQLGVDQVTLHGDCIVEFGPLIGRVPIVGALAVYFLDPPELSYSFTDAADSKIAFPLRKAVRKGVHVAVTSQVVVPHQVVVPIAPGEETSTHESVGMMKPPIAVLRVRPLRGTDLLDSDWHLGGTAKCDPYFDMRFGSQVWHSTAAKGTVNPEWSTGEFADFCVYSENQILTAKVYDEDWMKKDDFVGCIKPLSAIEALDMSEHSLQLFQSAKRIRTGACLTKGSGKGFVQMKFEWFEPCAEQSTIGHIVMATIGGIQFSDALASSVQLRMTVADQTQETPRRYTPRARIAAEAQLAEQELSKVVQRGKQMGLSHSDISRLTGLTEQAVLGMTREPPKGGFFQRCCGHSDHDDRLAEITVAQPATAGAEADDVAQVYMGSLLCLAVPGSVDLDQEALFELVDQNRQVVAKTTMPMSRFVLRWPPPTEAVMETLVLTTANGQLVPMQVELTLAGLVPKGSPRPAA